MTSTLPLLDLVKRMAGKKVLVVGDAIADEYYFGHVDRVCPEAPVPVFIEDSCETRSGGAANVFRQLEELGVSVGYSWGPPSYKQRYMVGSHLLLRVDDDSRASPDHEEILAARSKIPQYDAVVLSDYNKGWLTKEMCQNVIGVASQCRIPVIVDPKGDDWGKYYGAAYILPNSKERAAVGVIGWSTVIEKRGDKGLRWWRGDGYRDFPATARHVYDVTGAGDTVVAVFAAAELAGATVAQSCTLANLAAGYVVGEVGTTLCTYEKLKELARAHES